MGSAEVLDVQASSWSTFGELTISSQRENAGLAIAQNNVSQGRNVANETRIVGSVIYASVCRPCKSLACGCGLKVVVEGSGCVDQMTKRM